MTYSSADNASQNKTSFRGFGFNKVRAKYKKAYFDKTASRALNSFSCCDSTELKRSPPSSARVKINNFELISKTFVRMKTSNLTSWDCIKYFYLHRFIVAKFSRKKRNVIHAWPNKIFRSIINNFTVPLNGISAISENILINCFDLHRSWTNNKEIHFD